MPARCGVSGFRATKVEVTTYGVAVHADCRVPGATGRRTIAFAYGTAEVVRDQNEIAHGRIFSCRFELPTCPVTQSVSDASHMEVAQNPRSTPVKETGWCLVVSPARNL